MELRPQIEDQADQFIRELVAMRNPTKRIDRLAAFVLGTLTTLAGQIDLLRAELVEKGIDVAT